MRAAATTAIASDTFIPLAKEDNAAHSANMTRSQENPNIISNPSNNTGRK